MRLTPKRVVLYSIIALIVLIVGFVSLSLFGPSTPIVVSRETTYLTEPLDQWGNVDYVEAIRRQWSDGVTPENNAAALIWQALGPADISVGRRSAFFTELGIAPLPPDGDYFAEMYGDPARKEQAIAWMREKEAATVASAIEGLPPDPDVDFALLEFQQRSANVDAFDRFMQLTETTMHTPWRAQDLPPLADWLDDNQTPLELTVKASRRTRYYSPVMVDHSPTPGYGRMISMLLPDIQNARGLAQGLSHRAMLHLGEGRPREAWEDLKAAHRLSRLIGQQGILVQQLVAVAIDQLALRGDAALLHHGDLSGEQLREIRGFLMQRSSPCNIRQSVGTFERFAMLDTVTHAARFGFADPDFGSALLATRIDWNIPLRMANVWYDKLAAAMDHATIAERQVAISGIEAEIESLFQYSRKPSKLIGAIFSGRKRSEFAGEMMLALFLPALGAAQQAEDRSLTSLQLIQVASALAIHRAEQGAYPAALGDLADELRAELPVDPFTEKPFLYETRGEGYVLWSVGRNLTDDKASGREFCLTVDGEVADAETLGGNHDDVVLRVPWTEPQAPGTDEGG